MPFRGLAGPPHPARPSYREVAWRILQLLLQGLDMVGVHVGVAHDVHEVARAQARHLCAMGVRECAGGGD